MEKLCIKCPSCGIVLEVSNSKNEAVKRIVCPNCQKQLAVTFREEPQPAQYVDIKIVQLTDGSQKTIVRVLTDDHIVCVNGEQLQKDDEVVLAPGDKLEIDGKSQFTPVVGNAFPPAPKQTPKQDSNILAATSNPKQNDLFIYVAIVVVIVAGFVLWQKFSDFGTQTNIAEKTSTDTIVTTQKLDVEAKKQEEAKPKKDARRDRPQTEMHHQNEKNSLANMSDYELERQALNGNAEAQYLLGKRWVGKHDSVNVVKGINYLKLAARNGSSEARSTLNRVYAALQRSASNGSTMADNILREQR